MGNDGGSIPKRRELVKEAARLPTASELKETTLEAQTHGWTFCPLSSLPLDPHNTAADARGRLYNYESILQCLLPSSAGDAVPEAQAEAFRASGIRGLKDVVKVRFALRRDDKGAETRACPVSLKELGAATKAVYLVPCGHVFAEAALRELSGPDQPASKSTTATETQPEEEERRCPECSEAFESDNVIPILTASATELARLDKRIEGLKARGLSHNLKKDKSTGGKKKRKAEDGANGDKEDGKSKKEKADKSSAGIDSRINNPMTASLTAKVLAEQEENNKRRKIAAGLRREAVR